jgi:hypothetical protein
MDFHFVAKNFVFGPGRGVIGKLRASFWNLAQNPYGAT